jgi:hypothetical protein
VQPQVQPATQCSPVGRSQHIHAGTGTAQQQQPPLEGQPVEEASGQLPTQQTPQAAQVQPAKVESAAVAGQLAKAMSQQVGGVRGPAIDQQWASR